MGLTCNNCSLTACLLRNMKVLDQLNSGAEPQRVSVAYCWRERFTPCLLHHGPSRALCSCCCLCGCASRTDVSEACWSWEESRKLFFRCPGCLPRVACCPGNATVSTVEGLEPSLSAWACAWVVFVIVKLLPIDCRGIFLQ